MRRRREGGGVMEGERPCSVWEIEVVRRERCACLEEHVRVWDGCGRRRLRWRSGAAGETVRVHQRKYGRKKKERKQQSRKKV